MSSNALSKDDLTRFKYELVSELKAIFDLKNTVLDKDELIREIKELIEDKNLMSKRWLRSHEVKALLNISTGKLHTLHNQGLLTHSKIGGLKYYDLEEIQRILVENKVNDDLS